MKNYRFYKILSIVVLFLNSSFINPLFKTKENSFNKNSNYSVLPFEQPVSSNLIYLIDDFNGFKESLAFKESGGRYGVVNKLGYLGKYQFNLNTLKMYEITDIDNFITSPYIQEKVFLINVKRNKWILRKDINWFVGSVINGVKITESGIIAAEIGRAHV